MDDIHHWHSSDVGVLAACHNEDAGDLVALGCEYSVDVYQIDESCKLIASFHIGTRVTALAWSPRTVSPSSTDNWFIELAAATIDFGLHLLTKSPTDDDFIFPFGGGLSGHQRRVNDITFCGGNDQDSSRYLATVSDGMFCLSTLSPAHPPQDKMLMIWDLRPSFASRSPSPSSPSSPTPKPLPTPSPPLPLRPQPTAYAIPFSHPLISINSHSSTSKEFLVSDSRGSLYITDWRTDITDPSHDDQTEDNGYLPNLVELTDPHAYAHNTVAIPGAARLSGSAAWRKDTPDIIGATYGSRFSIWDMTNLHGGKPHMSGISFPEGGHRFRWCLTYPEIFAISTRSPHKGAIIHVHNANYLNAHPTPFAIAPRPHALSDFDFLALPGIPRIVAAIGRKLVIFSIGVES